MGEIYKMHSMQADSKKPRSTSPWSKEVDIALIAHWLSKKKLEDFSYDGAGAIKPSDIKARMFALRSRCPSMKALQKKSLKSLREQAMDLVDRTVKLLREKKESNDSGLSIHKPLRDEVLLWSQDHTDIRRSPFSFRRIAREQRSKNSYLRMPYPSLKYDANMHALLLPTPPSRNPFLP